MYYITDTDKSFEQASTDLEASVKNLGFGVLHIHNLGDTLRSKGVDFKENCKVFEVCNPKEAAKVLASLSDHGELLEIANGVESKTIQMIDDAK